MYFANYLVKCGGSKMIASLQGESGSAFHSNNYVNPVMYIIVVKKVNCFDSVKNK